VTRKRAPDGVRAYHRRQTSLAIAPSRNTILSPSGRYLGRGLSDQYEDCSHERWCGAVSRRSQCDGAMLV
jgi:hypothetical protein